MGPAAPGQAVGMVTDPPVSLVALLADWQRETRDELLPPLLHRAGHPDDVMPTPELSARTHAVRRLRQTMMPRETRKQRHLWPAVRDHVPGGGDAVDELIARKRSFEDALVKLRWADERSVAIELQLGDVVEQVLCYLSCERGLLPQIEQTVPASRQWKVVARLRTGSRLEPTQPHPDLPAAPWAAAALGPPVALADRIRDRFTTAPG